MTMMRKRTKTIPDKGSSKRAKDGKSKKIVSSKIPSLLVVLKFLMILKTNVLNACPI
jgi:hypothetical protein